MANFIVIDQIVGGSVGAIVALFLATLASRSQDRGRRPRILYAGCALVFYSCAVIIGVFSLIDSPEALLHMTGSVRLAAAAFLPVSAVGMWLDDESLSPRRRKLGKWLFGYSMISATVIVCAGVTSTWIVPRLPADAPLSDTLTSGLVHRALYYNGLSVIAAAVWLLLRNQSRGRFQRFAVWMMLAGLSIATVSVVARDFLGLPQPFRAWALLAKEQAVTLIVIGSLFYFARFRAVDVFLKLTLRLLAGVALALIAAALALGPIRNIAAESTLPATFEIAAYTTLVALVVFLMLRVARMTDAIVERHIFRTPDYARAAAELQERLALEESEPAVLAVTEEFVARALEALNVRIQPSAPPIDAASVEDVVQAPILVGSQSRYVLVVSSRSRQHIVMTVDVAFLREVAVIVGRRLEALAREQERVERARREAQLVHQVVSAELRALRAQLNPHFLFNALNAIAEHISTEPEKAESMIIQLAKVFRHLLAHSDKTFSSLEEEIEFLRTYLEIEKMRFGARLTVEFDVSEVAATASIPSLILQPLVENALKHGLAAKRGDNRLVIRADRHADALALSVEDNGVGISEPINAARSDGASGVGLRNIRERLRTIYGHRARLVLENVAQGGSRASVIIPLGETA